MAKLCNRNTNRSFMARIQLLDGKSIVAAAAPPQFDKHLQLNNVHASRVTPDNYCELMTFDENETESQRTNCQLILCEHAIRDKMLSNRDQSGENSYVYFVQNPNQSNTTTIDRGPATRCGTNNNGGNTKSKLKQFFRGHSINVLILLIFSLGLVDMVNAGTCWMKRTQGGKCKQPMETNVTRAECCALGDDVGFSEKEMNQYEYFFATAIGDGTSCSSCTDSCSTAKCGPQKRCVIRGGEPKCVCAPKCKTSSPLSASHHTKQRFGDAQKSRRNINGNAHERDQRYHRRHSSSSSSLTDAPIAIHNRINGGGGSGADGGGGGDDGSGLMAARYSFNQNNNHKNASMPKKDKVISIVSPSSQNSHRFRKNSHLSMIKSPSSSQHHHQAHNETAQNHEHRDLRHGRKHRYNQHGGVDHRRNEQNASWEDRIRSGFYGHDLPYPPDDVPLKTFDDDHQYHRAVCGSDGKTYGSECQLRKRACRQDLTTLVVAYKGQCQTSCKHVQCPSGQHCLEDQNLMPHCVVCSMKCPPYDPTVKSTITNPSRLVCGADGITYRNLCEIKRTACMLGRSIPVAYRGPCKEAANCHSIKCKYRQVCLTDLITHRPRCVSCSFKCPRRKRPQGQQSTHIKICGANSKMYHSWCQMMKDSCNTGYFIDVKHNGVCHAHNTQTTIMKKQKQIT